MNDETTLAGSAAETPQPETTETVTANETQSQTTEQVEGDQEGAKASEDQSEAKPAEGGEGQSEASQEDPEKAQRRRSAQERINQLTAQKRQAERERDDALARAERLEERAGGSDDAAPDPLDFGSDAEFQAALTAYQVRQATREDKKQDAEDARRQAETAGKTAADAQVAEFKVRAADFAQDVPDFDDTVMNNPTFALSNEATSQVMQSEQGPAVAYYLAKNRDEAARLSGLTNPTDVAREIGKIEGRLTAPTPKTISQAPKPVKGVATGSGSASAFDANKASVDDMEKHLRDEGVI